MLHAQAQAVGVPPELLEGFKQQMFGAASERPLVLDPRQLGLDGLVAAPETVKKHHAAVRRRRSTRPAAARDDPSAAFFDKARVQVKTIELPNLQAAGLAPEQFEVIGHKVGYRLAQRPGNYVVLKYVRPVIKRRDTRLLSCPPMPEGVLEGSRADVSFIAAVIVEKFAYHVPLYRQRRRLVESGIRPSGPWLTQLTQKAMELLEPIYRAQLESIRISQVQAFDATPIQAGPVGKMSKGYFWPVYGGQDEVCFPQFPSRAAENVHTVLGHAPGTVLLTEGRAAYQSYAKKIGVTHPECWGRCRRAFLEAEADDFEGVRQALQQIDVLYAIEADMLELRLEREPRRLHRLTYSKPSVDIFFEWIRSQLGSPGLGRDRPFALALEYARERRAGLEVFLTDPDVPLDMSLEAGVPPVTPLGQTSWSLSSTELEARHVAIAQSLIVTCRLHNVDPYTYLVDVLQRVGRHPASRVAELTPRLWKQHFAANPLRSELHRLED